MAPVSSGRSDQWFDLTEEYSPGGFVTCGYLPRDGKFAIISNRSRQDIRFQFRRQIQNNSSSI
jgi:hypothetical protein